MRINQRKYFQLLLCALTLSSVVGCGDRSANSTTGTSSMVKKNNEGSSFLGGKKNEVTIIGKDPENIKSQKFGETVLMDWSSPDGSFTMKLPSAARCTEKSSGPTDLVVMCMAASPDVVSFFTYTYFDQGENTTVDQKVSVLQEQAKRNLDGDKSASKSGTTTYVADIQTRVVNDTPMVESINATGQNVFQSVSFFKGPFLISITTRPNPKSPKALDFVKAITQSVTPTLGEHRFVEELRAPNAKDQVAK